MSRYVGSSLACCLFDHSLDARTFFIRNQSHGRGVVRHTIQPLMRMVGYCPAHIQEFEFAGVILILYKKLHQDGTELSFWL